MLVEILSIIGITGTLATVVEFAIVLGAGKALYDFIQKKK